jgi:FAD-linked sulfhydryl oxidase
MKKFVGRVAAVVPVVWNAASSTTVKCDSRRQNIKECEHPACASKMDLFKRAQSAYSTHEDVTEKGRGSGGIASVTTPSTPPPPLVDNCPLDREELGRSTWNLLHTIAAYYPEQPTLTEQEGVRQLFLALAQFYPCEVCAEDFRDSIAENPPRYDVVFVLMLRCILLP